MIDGRIYRVLGVDLKESYVDILFSIALSFAILPLTCYLMAAELAGFLRGKETVHGHG